MKARFLLVLATLLVLPSQASQGLRSTPELWEAWYSVSARVRTRSIDADLEAGGRLAMTGRAHPSGKLTLTLDQVLEHPWKLYWVDPLGPIGEEIKVASVVTLRETSWDALAAAQIENEIWAADRHRRWRETAQRPRELDGSFAFVVIGDARNGFSFEIGPGGSVSSITNRMTDRWLFGPFDQFVDTTASETGGTGRAVPGPLGYWFWNRGEEKPHGYEPHTYHAFAAALALLSLPLPQVSEPAASTEEPLIWHEAGQKAHRVLSILAPRMDASAFRKEFSPRTQVTGTREASPKGGIRLTLASAAETPQPHIDRETVFSSEGRLLSDRIRVRIIESGGASLEVEAGYRPQEAREELK